MFRHLTKYSTIAEFLASKCLGEFDKCNQAELGGRIEEEQRVKQELTAAEQIILAQRKELDRSVYHLLVAGADSCRADHPGPAQGSG